MQSAVNACRQGDEKPSSSVVAETMKLFKNGSYGYHFIYRSRYSLTGYMNGEKTLAAINKKFFNKLGHISDQFDEVELAKSAIGDKEPFVLGHFFLH